MKLSRNLLKRIVGIGFLVSCLFGIIIALVICLPTSPNKALLSRVESELKKHDIFFPEAEYAILIDYFKPVFKRRLWVVDIKTGEVLVNAHVSHARKSGLIYPTVFSNQDNSFLSCTGTFKTHYSYESCVGEGSYKVGMRIDGLDWGKNDRAMDRDIVFHCTKKDIWSKGCFMTLPRVNKRIIDLASTGNIVIVDGPEYTP